MGSAPAAHRPEDVDFQLLVEALPHIVCIVGSTGVLKYLNERGAAYVGELGVVGSAVPWVSLVHPDDLWATKQAWVVAAHDQAPFETECRLRRRDGNHRWHLIRAHPRCDRRGALAAWVGTATDIEAAKAQEDRLRSGERKAAETVALLETLQSNAPVGFGFVDRDYRRVLVNDVLAAFNGSTVEKQVGRLIPDLVPLLWPQLEPNYRSVLDTGTPVLNVEVGGPAADDPSSEGHWVVSYYPVDVQGDVVGVGVVANEVTDRWQADRVQRLMSAIVESSDNAIFASTPDGLITTWNGAGVRLFGYTAGEAIGQPMSLLVPDRFVDHLQALRCRLVAGGPAERHDTQLLRRDGSEVQVHFIASPVADEAGSVVGLSMSVEDITERIAAQRELLASQRQLADAQRIAEIGSFEIDLVSGTSTWSAELYRILGLDPAVSPSGQLFLGMVHPDDRHVLEQGWSDVMTQGVARELTYRVIRADQTVLWIDGRAATEIADDGRTTKLFGTMRNATQRVEAAQAQRAAEIRISAGFEQGGIGAALLDLDGLPTRVNAAACALLGRPEEELIGRSWSDFLHPDETPLGAAVLARQAVGLDTFAPERRYVRPDGTVVWVAMHITLVRDDLGEPAYYLGQIRDVGERRKLEADLRHQALHDDLTGLPNRVLLSNRITDGLAATRACGVDLAVVYLDLDNIKTVNDTLGHPAGDQLLVRVAARITEVIRPGDTVARFGGDSFAVVCDNAGAQDARKIAEQVRAAIAKPCSIGVHELQVTASFGIAIADDVATPESLLSDADAAMYVAKGRGKDRVELFANELRASAEARLATTHALRYALEREELVVHYQPVVDLQSGRMVSAEALLRWNDPDRGPVSPAEFIPLAEDSGLIIPIGAWVLEQACTQLVEWQRDAPSMSVAVNLSARQLLTPDITEVIGEILSRTGVAPARVCLELTESVLMEDPDYFGATLTAIKALGVTLSIDDFGTGYSSLSYLKQFPVDCIKIDRSFVNGLGVDPDDSTLVAAIVAMGAALNLTVTAEGIENDGQLAILADLSCSRGQGFFLARPGPPATVSELLRGAYEWPVHSHGHAHQI